MSFKEKTLNINESLLRKKQYNKLWVLMAWWLPLFPEFFEIPQTCALCLQTVLSGNKKGCFPAF